MNSIKLAIFIGALLPGSPVCEAKKRCNPLLDKLYEVQAMQRNGYSSERGVSLRINEDKARDKWWACEKGQNVKQKTKSKLKKNRKNTISSKQKVKRYNANYKQSRRVKLLTGTRLKPSNAFALASTFQEDKTQAWFKFYQQPKGCNHPKSLAEFVSCSEDKQAQRANFEQEYELAIK